ncbi:MAG: hypothetical protein ACI85O_000690 [Saprospiraceae bacterium]|jgi:hypothetical protein
MRLLLLSLFCLACTPLFAQKQKYQTPFEQQENYSATYQETIKYYEKLAESFPKQMQLKEYGMTDAGFPLHLAILSKDGDFLPKNIQKNNKRILLVNNAIHPGEPCGVDATMMLFRDYLTQKDKQVDLENVVVIAIPFYNIGGGLNRGEYSRANQEGPSEHGFRGNAKNLDLNRDFIKNDSKNAQTFVQIWNEWQPDVFLDNHTSNGADYQYTMTMIATQKEKLSPLLSDYLQQDMLPKLYADMKTANWEMTPYVNVQNTPDEGVYGFLDLPRYSSGYAAMHNALSFMGETHMLKPFKDRVLSTYAFMEVLIKRVNADHQKIGHLREMTRQAITKQTTFPLNWEIDLAAKEDLLFKGYTAKYKKSEISGLDRLYYDRAAPYEKNIPFYNTYKTTLSIKKPLSYIIPQAYSEVADRLKANGVTVNQLTESVFIPCEMYYIDSYESRKSPYEGHYLHYNVKVRTENVQQPFRKGDYVVEVNQSSNRFIVETLEPQAPDSYFAWNFFDGILMQKEYFSAYVFEEIAAEILRENPTLRAELEEKRKNDAEFAKSGRAQLDFVYKHSPHYEPTHQLYPIGRLVQDVELSVK